MAQISSGGIGGGSSNSPVAGGMGGITIKPKEKYVNPLLLINNQKYQALSSPPPERKYFIENDTCGEYITGPNQENALIYDYEQITTVEGNIEWRYLETLKLPVFCKYCKDLMDIAKVQPDQLPPNKTTTKDKDTGITYVNYDAGDPEETKYNYIDYNNLTYGRKSFVANLGNDFFKGSSLCFEYTDFKDGENEVLPGQKFRPHKYFWGQIQLYDAVYLNDVTKPLLTEMNYTDYITQQKRIKSLKNMFKSELISTLNFTGEPFTNMTSTYIKNQWSVDQYLQDKSINNPDFALNDIHSM